MEEVSDAGVWEAGMSPSAEPFFTANSARMRLASSVYVGDGVVLSNWHVCTSNTDTTFFHASEIDGGMPYVEGSPLCVFEDDPPVVVPGCERVAVGTDHGSLSGRIVFAAKNIDLCIVQLDQSDLMLPPTLQLDTQPVHLGQSVIVSGYPGGVAKRVTEHCKVVQEPRLVRDPDQDAPTDSAVWSFGLDCKTVEHGSSGSPVFSEQGKLIGLVWTRECANSHCDGIAYATAASQWRTQLAGRPLIQYSRLDDLLRRYGNH